MKEYESETKHFLYSTFMQQKQLFIVNKHALEDFGLSHHERTREANQVGENGSSIFTWFAKAVSFYHV